MMNFTLVHKSCHCLLWFYYNWLTNTVDTPNLKPRQLELTPVGHGLWHTKYRFQSVSIQFGFGLRMYVDWTTLLWVSSVLDLGVSTVHSQIHICMVRFRWHWHFNCKTIFFRGLKMLLFCDWPNRNIMISIPHITGLTQTAWITIYIPHLIGQVKRLINIPYVIGQLEVEWKPSVVDRTKGDNHQEQHNLKKTCIQQFPTKRKQTFKISSLS